MITSDTHFGHKRIIDYGRDADFENKILESFKELTSDDILIHLGDVCIGQDARFNELFKSLPCKCVLVKGNHDGKTLTFYSKYWDFVCDEFMLRFHGLNILFSHKPRKKRSNIDLNIHGHLHVLDRFNNRTEDGVVVDDEFGFEYDLKYHKLISLEANDYKLSNLKNICDVQSVEKK